MHLVMMRVQYTWPCCEMPPTLLQRLPREVKLPDRSQQWCQDTVTYRMRDLPACTELTSTHLGVFRQND